MEIRHAASPLDAKHYTTERLRKDFLMERLMVPGEINFVYSHYDRVITGGVVPTKPIKLGTYDALRAEYFLERRELGIINVGGEGAVSVEGQKYSLSKKDCLYIGLGNKEVVFESTVNSNPAHFYIVSAPAHKNYPTTKMEMNQASPVDLGSLKTSNERRIYKYIHAEGIKSCQLVMGLTTLKDGNVWNTMPPHVHDRRMEVYFYFDIEDNAKVFHFMGEPDETRHLLVANHQGIISPPWSIHCGSGTTSYSFIWAMGGENYNYTDMDVIDLKNLK